MKPLGWYRGSDGQEFTFGMTYFNNNDLIAKISTGTTDSGEEAIINRPYESYLDYKKEPFPSGDVKKIAYLRTNIIYQFKKNYSISSSFYLSKNINIVNLKLNIPIYQLFKK